MRPITSLRRPQKVLVRTQSAAESEKIIVVSNSLMPRSAAMGGSTAKTSVCPMPTESRQTKRMKKARLRSCGVVLRMASGTGDGFASAAVFSAVPGSSVSDMKRGAFRAAASPARGRPFLYVKRRALSSPGSGRRAKRQHAAGTMLAIDGADPLRAGMPRPAAEPGVDPRRTGKREFHVGMRRIAGGCKECRGRDIGDRKCCRRRDTPTSRPARRRGRARPG